MYTTSKKADKKIEKDIGDIKQVIKLHYSLVENEVFYQKDEHTRIKYIQIPTGSDKGMIFINLNKIPEEKSAASQATLCKPVS